MHKVSKKDFWEERYIQKHMPWDIGEVCPAFVKYLNKNPYNFKTGQKIAVLGCGLGHDAFYLASLSNYNFLVDSFDFVSFAIDYCNEIKEKNKLKEINFYQRDIFDLTKDNSLKEKYNYVIEHTCLAAIDPDRRCEYVDLVKQLLKPGGKLIGMFFVRPKELGGPPFGISPDEVKALFQGGFIEVEKPHPEECLHGENLKGEEWFGVFEKANKK